MILRKTVATDQTRIANLYQRVATVPGGLARLESEITSEYLQNVIEKTTHNGVGFVALNAEEHLIGEIHAYSPEVSCFSHVLTELTIAIDPDYQTQGVGRLLFEKFISHVASECPKISRIELFARESNVKAIDFYKSMEFKVEGEFLGRIKNGDGTCEADIAMAWYRP